MKVQVVWNMTPYQMVNSYQDSGELVISAYKVKDVWNSNIHTRKCFE